MTTIPAPGSRIWPEEVFAGMIVETNAGEQVEVQEIDAGWNTMTFSNGHGNAAVVNVAYRIKLLGYFNPE